MSVLKFCFKSALVIKNVKLHELGKLTLTFLLGWYIIENAKSKIPGVIALVNCFWHGEPRRSPFSFKIIAFLLLLCQEKKRTILQVVRAALSESIHIWLEVPT